MFFVCFHQLFRLSYDADESTVSYSQQNWGLDDHFASLKGIKRLFFVWEFVPLCQQIELFQEVISSHSLKLNRLLCPSLGILPVRMNSGYKSPKIQEIRSGRLILPNRGSLKGQELMKTQDNQPRIIRITNKPQVILRHWYNSLVWTTVQQIKELYS